MQLVFNSRGALPDSKILSACKYEEKSHRGGWNAVCKSFKQGLWLQLSRYGTYYLFFAVYFVVVVSLKRLFLYLYEGKRHCKYVN